MNKNRAVISFFLFAPLLVMLAFISVWVLSNNYSNDIAIFNWSKAITLLSSSGVKPEDIGLIYPHIPIYQLFPFFYLGGLDNSGAPYAASVLTGAILLVIWFNHLAQKGYSSLLSILFVILIASHPLFLWAVTSGTEKALSLLFFYLLCYSIVRLIHVVDIHAFIMLGATLGAFFFVDERTFYLFIALLPLIVFIAPIKMLKASPVSIYISICLPLLIAIAAWVYLNWLITGDPLEFIHNEDSSFLGARLHASEFDWLQQSGGALLKPFFLGTIYALLSFPVLIWMILRSRRHEILLRGICVFLLHPLIAISLATYSFFLDHPANIIFLFSAGLMIIFILLPRLTKKDQLVTVVFLLLGNVTGWYAFSWQQTEEMHHWQLALNGQMIHSEYETDINLGRWLAENPATTMIDSRAGYRVIVEKQQATGLILPFMKEFKLALKQRSPDIDQIALTNPNRDIARKDQVTQRFRTLYHYGLPGYTKVYDRGHWRVYQRSEGRPDASKDS